MFELKKKSLDWFINRINIDFSWDHSVEHFYLPKQVGISFLDIHKYIIKRSNNLVDEVKENLMFLSSDKHLPYLDFVEERIRRDVVSNIDSSILDKWIEKYNVSEFVFPFTENNDLKKILSRAIDEYIEEVAPSDELIMEIQKDFYLYSYYLEKNKIIEFIESKKNEINKQITTSYSDELRDSKNNENPYPHVFSDIKAYNLFNRLFEQYKDSKNTIADFSFIYRMMYKDGYILSHFKPQMFIEWINQEPYTISLDKIKTIGDCSTSQKSSIYSTSKEIIQID